MIPTTSLPGVLGAAAALPLAGCFASTPPPAATGPLSAPSYARVVEAIRADSGARVASDYVHGRAVVGFEFGSAGQPDRELVQL